jgi:hypothetical protein
MRGRFAIVGILAALAAFGGPESARAQQAAPLIVTIVGQGAIRVRIDGDARRTVCGDSGARRVFDGWLSPGSYAITTPSTVICYQYTHGYFRETDWTTQQTTATPAHNVLYTD